MDRSCASPIHQKETWEQICVYLQTEINTYILPTPHSSLSTLSEKKKKSVSKVSKHPVFPLLTLTAIPTAISSVCSAEIYICGAAQRIWPLYISET